MVPPPTGLGIETLLLPLYALPAKVVPTIVRVDRFHHMIGFAIASFAAMDFVIQQTHYLIPTRSVDFSLRQTYTQTEVYAAAEFSAPAPTTRLS